MTRVGSHSSLTRSGQLTMREPDTHRSHRKVRSMSESFVKPTYEPITAASVKKLYDAEMEKIQDLRGGSNSAQGTY